MNIEKLTQIVNKYDPIHLIKMGLPNDEYQPEIADIFVALQERSMNEFELTEKIKEIFIRWFNETTVNDHGMEVYKNLAHEILMEWKREQE